HRRDSVQYSFWYQVHTCRPGRLVYTWYEILFSSAGSTRCTPVVQDDKCTHGQDTVQCWEYQVHTCRPGRLVYTWTGYCSVLLLVPGAHLSSWTTSVHLV